MFHHLPLIRVWQRLVRDRNGAAAIIFALSVPVMLGFTGLAVEVGSWFVEQRAMQGAADAASTAAATVLSLNSSCVVSGTNICTNEATSVAAMNGWVNGANGVAVAVNIPPASGPYSSNTSAVQVIITKTGTNWFSSILPASYKAPTLAAGSVALAQPGIDCLLSLSNANGTGVNFALLFGSVSMPNCSIGDNSQGSSALAETGFLTSVTAYSATVYGGISSGFLNSFTWTKTPVQNKGTVTPDPYACPGTECRTMPTATVPTALTPSTIALPTNCTGNGGNQITGSITLAAGTCYQGPTLSSGTITVAAGACTSGAPCTIMSPFTSTTKKGKTTTTYNGPAIGVSGSATVNITGGGSLTILGGTGEPAINVTGGTLNMTTGTNIIQAGSAAAGIAVSGGTVTIDATANAIQGGTNSPAIKLTGVLPILTFGASNNNILAGTGSPAIEVSPTSGNNVTVGGQLTFGNGNNHIQGAAPDNGAFSAMTLGGFGHVVFGNGNTVFGGPAVTLGVPAVADQAGFLFNNGLGLVLGSGTFQFMEGISVTGGDLTLNPPATSGGIGYYIMDGGGSTNGAAGSPGTGLVGSGFNMTYGTLVGANATIVLTGGSAGGVGADDYANINFNTAFDLDTGFGGVTLTAPTVAGTWDTAGIAIFQDRSASSGNANIVYGFNFDNITGAIYTPSQPLEFEGIYVMTSQCMQMIASTITIRGLAFINDQCEGTGTAPVAGNGSIVLVQ